MIAMRRRLYQRFTAVFGLAAALGAVASMAHAEDKLLKEDCGVALNDERLVIEGDKGRHFATGIQS